jgi:hypothetical protein
MIIGSQKSGTSSLAHYLSLHPNVRFSSVKELHFFNQNINQPLSEYKHYFPTIPFKKIYRKSIAGEATPDYMIYPQFSETLSKIAPDIKLIVLLKNPVDRAFSHYKHNLMMKREWLSFEDALAIENKRIDLNYIDLFKTKKDAIKNYSNYSYKEKGIYYRQLKWLFSKFPKKNIKIIEFKEFINNTESVYDDTCSFLGIKTSRIKSFEAKNVSKINIEFNIETRIQLKAFFEPHNKKLFKLIGTEYNWD